MIRNRRTSEIRRQLRVRRIRHQRRGRRALPSQPSDIPVGKLLDEPKIDRVRLHDARHSCATLMHLRGVPIVTIAAWLGHASAAFTMAVCAHSQDQAPKAAASSFGCQIPAPLDE